MFAPSDMNYSSFLLHQILKVPGVEYVSDEGTPDGHMYYVNYGGQRYLLYAMSTENYKGVTVHVIGTEKNKLYPFGDN